MSSLKYLFSPKSIAVIGASRTPGKIGYEILENLKEYGFKGKLYPINPHATEVLGLKAYPSITEVPDEVDMAVIAIPAAAVPSVLEECGKKGVKVVVVISSGFKEVGNVELEEKIVEIARKYDMRLLGPNIFGIFYAGSYMNATFGPRNVVPGTIAFISQSGALGIALMGWTVLEGIGLSAIISVGNKADIDDADLIDFLGQDENTRVILIYMEGVKRAREFMNVARKVTTKKPIIVLKAGRSERGMRAVASHTGSLAGSDVIYNAAFKQCGVLRAMNVEEAFDWARAFASLPEPKGENVIIVTNGGGLGVMATDAAQDYGLKLLEPPKDLMDKFRRFMPPFGSPRNPVDLTGQATEREYHGAISAALGDNRVHSVIVLYCETAVADPIKVAEGILKAKQEASMEKPLVAAFIGGVNTARAIKFLNENGVPTYPTAERAVSSLAALYKWSSWRRRASQK
ncbi:MAG: acetyl CoA synthetase [Thermoprotei archaeon]|nr:MAG: acetyl CoA synthetase [Thermoprotei archaeon]RLF00003.1 MAG: acetyl CoA synthetase [Thermoprotei archaeon]